MPFAVYVLFQAVGNLSVEKQMQNSETESRQRLDMPEGVPECTPSGEVHGLCAVFQAILHAEEEVAVRRIRPIGLIGHFFQLIGNFTNFVHYRQHIFAVILRDFGSVSQCFYAV